MNKRIKKLWVDALRSGKYKQSKGQLKRIRSDGSVGFCCLGVLCDIYAKEKNIVGWKSPNYIGEIPFSKKMFTTELPRSVMNWSNFDLSEDVLIEMNDVKRSKFSSIANFIEKII